jgi:hypothetical protein
MDDLEAPRIPEGSLEGELLEEEGAPADQDKGVCRSKAALLCFCFDGGDEGRHMGFGVGGREDGDKALFSSLS